MSTVVAAVVLSLSLKPGTAFVYEVTRTYTNSEHRETTVFRDKVTHVVEQEVEPGWFRIRRERLPLESVYDSVKVPAPEGTLPLVVREERSARNTVRLIEPELPDPHWMERAQRPLRVFFPLPAVKVGDTWGHEAPEDEARLPAFQAEWILRGADDRTVTIEIKFTETGIPVPVEADGTVVLDRSTCWPLSLDVKVRNVRVPDDEEPTPVELHVVWKYLGPRPAG
jgi:hypothetical protein